MAMSIQDLIAKAKGDSSMSSSSIDDNSKTRKVERKKEKIEKRNRRILIPGTSPSSPTWDTYDIVSPTQLHEQQTHEFNMLSSIEEEKQQEHILQEVKVRELEKEKERKARHEEIIRTSKEKLPWLRMCKNCYPYRKHLITDPSQTLIKCNLGWCDPEYLYKKNPEAEARKKAFIEYMESMGD